jgi:hypothetical protein
MAEDTYTFSLAPGEKKRYMAGAYDKKNNTPNYSYTIMISCHAESDILVKQFLLNCGNEYQWGYDFNNTSSNLEAYIKIYKNGYLVPSAH